MVTAEDLRAKLATAEAELADTKWFRDLAVKCIRSIRETVGLDPYGAYPWPEEWRLDTESSVRNAIADLRAKLSKAEAEVARLSGRTGFCAECEALAKKLAEAENAAAAARNGRDSAIAAQNEVAVRELEAEARRILTAWWKDADVDEFDSEIHRQTQRELKKLARKVLALRAERPKPADPVPDAADAMPKTEAKPDAGDDVLRLFHVQDGDRPMYVVARDWSAALDAWWRVIRAENEGVEDLEEPDGISMVARADDLLIDDGGR